MAVTPFKPVATTPPPDDPRVKEVMRRVTRAKIDRGRHQARIADCNKYGLPWRHKFGASQPSDQLDEIFDPIAMTVIQDFAADMQNTFTPQKSAWLEIKPVMTIRPAEAREIAEQIQIFQEIVFSEMRRSNLYQALQEGYLDLGPGTMALIIQDRNVSDPIHCQAIPLTELLIDRGPYGEVDGRWREWRVKGEDIAVLWPSARTELDEPYKPDDGTEYEVIDGVYRDWTDRGTEVWRYIVLIGNRIAYEETYIGIGSCPMVVARWSRDSTTAWGVGPTYLSLPEIKTVNQMRYLLLKQWDKIVDPPFRYEDDGVVNFDQGINPGMGIPSAPGSKDFQILLAEGKFDAAFIQYDQVISNIKRAHYQDRPEQLGKTPPTATQWADEAAERARRMGSPATNLVHELQYPIFQRFAYLLGRRGLLPKIQLNGQVIAIEPISPLLRAQEQEEVVRMDRFVEMISGRLGPQIANLIIDQFKWAHRLAERMGVPADTLRNEAQLKQAISQFAPVLGQVGGQSGDVAANAPNPIP